MKSTDGVVCAAGRAQIVRAADPDSPFERLEANPHTFRAAHCLRAAGDLAVGEIRLDQVHQGSAGLARIGRRQGMREYPGLNFIAASGVAEHGTLEFVEHHEDGAQCVVRHIAGTPGAAHETQMQQAAHTAPFVVQAKRQSAMQIRDQQHGLGGDMVGVRCDRYFREIFSQMEGPFVTPTMLRLTWGFALPSKSRFLPITKGTIARFDLRVPLIDKDRQ